MAGLNCYKKYSFAVCIVLLAVGCSDPGGTNFANHEEPEQKQVSSMLKLPKVTLERETSDFEPVAQPLKLELQPSVTQPLDSGNDFALQRPAAAMTIPPQTPPARSVQQFNRRAAPVGERMAVMSAAEVETDHPPSQTTINVFYATDRKSKHAVTARDWVNVHFGALIALAVYLVTFAGVFVSQRKVFFGVVAFTSLFAFLMLGQSAMVKWQKQKRLASNEDAIYVSEIRPTHSDEMLDFGTCEVTIPPDHKIGRIDSPSLFKLEFTETPERHVVLHRVIRNESKDDFYDELNSAIGNSEERQALVFIHGYNVSFDNAVKRTAQIVHDLSFDGAPICYSWSSHGALANYTKDMANADATVVALQSFLQETVRRTGNSTIHLVAHSMGNRALLQALDRIAVGSTRASSKMFGQLVMAAPDVSAVDFRNRFAQSAIHLADSVTLYASSRDRALLASTEIHGHNRAGLAGENIVVMDGIDTIDVSEIDTSLIGHSYYGDHPEMIRDLRALVELAQPASNRNWLTRMTNTENLDFFRFTETEPIRSAEDSQFPRR